MSQRKNSIKKNYLPSSLSKKDRAKQLQQLKKSIALYKKKKYFTREKVKSFKSKKSQHIIKAEKMYKVKSLKPSKLLAKRSLCSLSALKKIVRKGQGAYYSSGSRPNQTAQSWAYARLGSALTGGKASFVDYAILEKGCQKKSKALRLAKKLKKTTKKLRRAIKVA